MRPAEQVNQTSATIDLTEISGHVHFIGIGGIGMSALARLLLARDIHVTGSDKEPNSITKELEQLGARIMIGHQLKNIEGASVVAVSTAITEQNPELEGA